MFAQIRAVVFDLDGLMFDTEALFFRVSSDMLAARGKWISPEIMRAMIGRFEPPLHLLHLSATRARA